MKKVDFKNFVLIGASSEVAVAFSKLLKQKELNQILITSTILEISYT